MGHMKKWRKSLQVQLDAVHQQELGQWLDKHHPVPKPYGPPCVLPLHCSLDAHLASFAGFAIGVA